MSKELVIASSAHETKVAILEDDQLVEIYFQRANEYSLAGSIHKGRVTRVLPGMQSAFVDLGLERDTFLYVSDFLEENGEDFDRVEERPQQSREQGGGRDRDRDRGRGRDRDRDRDRDRNASAEDTRREPTGVIQPPPASVAIPVEPVEATAAEDAVAEPVVERVEDQGRDDRRGRRSRRRRSRGRGFPDSKYASDLPAPAEAEEPVETVDEPVVAAAPPAEVFLLPGESLRKYRNRPAADESVSIAEPSEPEDQTETDTDLDADTVEVAAVEPEEAPAEETEVVAAVEAAPVAEPETASEDEPEAAPEEAAADELEPEPEAEEAGPDPEEAAAEPEFVSEEDEDSVTDAVEAAADAAESGVSADDEQDEVETTDEEAAEAEAGIDEAEGEESESDADAEVEAGETTEDAPQSESEPGTEGASAGSADGEPDSASASVRDQSNRYQHRQSRRMRRGRRGEGRGGDRPPREEQQAPVVATPVTVAAEAQETPRSGGRERERAPLPSISDLLREGQEIIVQIAKEPLGQKGARITSHIALPGRFVVFMPTLEHLGVSRKIDSDEERQRLKKILQASRQGITGGFIVRTAGEGRTEEEIAGDMAYLYNLWLDIRQKAEKKKAPALLHHDLDIVHRILRDQLSDMFKAVWIDNEDTYESVLRFMQTFNPALVGRIKMYTRQAPIFDSFGITAEIEKALRPKVWLKSGGYIVINQTEALVAIDVNTGKFVGKSNRLEDTITRTNTDAVKEIVRQIRLRDLGGIIVVDFIDMDERKNRQKVMQALEEAMRADRAPYKILQFNDFGLVAITRKRVKQSLERSLCSPCPTCEGAGYTKSVTTVVGEILVEAVKLRKNVEGNNVELRVYPEVAKFLKANTNDYLEELEGILKRPVIVISDPMLHPEKFDISW